METDEQPLLNAARRMDEEALVRIFDLYASPLYNYALRLCGDPVLADHIVGDVFAKLLEQLAAGKGPTSNLRSYLYEMAHHRFVDEARHFHRRVSLEALSLGRPDLRAQVLGVEDRIMFKKVLDAIQHDLTDDQRHVIILRFLEGFNLHETAAILGKDSDHVKVIQNRAIAKLRTVFERHEIRAAMSLSRIGERSNAFST
jgi:RNA polymerase sigma-70 factor (ECF subfamily)